MTPALLHHIETLRTERDTWKTHHQDLADVIQPRKSPSYRPSIIPDKNRTALHVDTTAMLANQTLANGQMAKITPYGTRWFSIRPPARLRNSPAAVRWYSYATEALESALIASNCYTVLHEQYLDRGCFGIAAMEITDGENGRGLNFTPYEVGTFSPKQNRYGKIDTIVRDFELTPADAYAMYGENIQWSDGIRTAYQNTATRHTQKFPFVHYIAPRPQRDPQNPHSKHKPFASIHICMDGDPYTVLESGFDENPVMCSRWMTWGNSSFGWSPGFYALPTQNQANHLEIIGDYLAELSAIPRILYPAGMSNDIDLSPGGMTSFDPSFTESQMPREWATQGRYDILEARMEKKQTIIRECFFYDLFRQVSEIDKTLTAYETGQIIAEKRGLFHPIFTRATTELLSPMLQRSFALLLRQSIKYPNLQILPPIPPEVLEQDENGASIPDPDVEYISPLAKALEETHLSSIPEVLNMLMPLAQLDPSILDSVATEKIYPTLARSRNIPEILIRTPEEIEARNQQRAQAAQMQQGTELASMLQKAGGAQGLKDLGITE